MMNLWDWASENEFGHSLIELLIVLACIVTMISLAVPNIAHLQKEWTLWGSARSVENSLQWGRMHAIASNTPILFEVDENGSRYGWIDPESGAFYSESIRFLGTGIRIASSPRRALRFYPQGYAVPAGTYVLEGETGSYSVIVSPGGRIRFQKN
jgi:Tfp pilus assembly protein FimT